MLSVNGKSHVIRHVLILQIFGAPKKLRFRQNPEKVLNWLNSANWAELHKRHVQGSRGKVTCRGHVDGVACRGHASCSGWSAFTDGRSFNSTDSSRVKRRCQLVIRLKANKCYQELLCSLSSYINLLSLLNLQGLCGWLLAPGRFPTSSPWSKPLINSNLKGVLVLVLMFDQLFGQSSGQLVAIRPFSDKLLVLSRFDCSRMSCSTSVARPVNGSRLFTCVNCLAPWLLYITILDCPRLHQVVVVGSAGQLCATLVGRFLLV